MDMTVSFSRNLEHSGHLPELVESPGHQQAERLLAALRAGTAGEVLPRYAGDRRGGSYADRRIGRALFDDLPPLASLAPHTQAHQVEVRTAVNKLEDALGRPPRAKEVADALGWPLSTFHHRMVEAGAGGLREGDRPVESLDTAPRTSA